MSEQSGYYILVDYIPKPVLLNEWVRWRMDNNDKRRVALDRVGDTVISTIFVGLDYGYGDGPPEIFETMIFGSDEEELLGRYATWELALEGHRKAVESLRARINQ
jgi:hypothetical protein